MTCARCKPFNPTNWCKPRPVSTSVKQRKAPGGKMFTVKVAQTAQKIRQRVARPLMLLRHSLMLREFAHKYVIV